MADFIKAVIIWLNNHTWKFLVGFYVATIVLYICGTIYFLFWEVLMSFAVIVPCVVVILVFVYIWCRLVKWAKNH